MAGTRLPEASFNWNVLALTVEGFSASLNVALTVVDGTTPLAPDAGEVELTVGGVKSAGAE